ncbi:MAG: GAF domain-containing protein [Hyphomicrobiales bacterium]|nr:MAG: GAF domain-containing protein [Hyphomicrobiales bacterium]
MQSAPMRDLESESIEALLNLEVLDTDSEPEFDALAHAAATVCDAPTALISLIDTDRQWFKARVGFDGPAETSRDLSFCAYAVLNDELLLVEDASLDARFADHPSVTGDEHLRFYAGVPLRLSNGLPIGSLCVTDRMPRRLYAAQRAALERLGVAVVRALEGRSAIRQLRRSTEDVLTEMGFEAHIDIALRNVDAAMRELPLSSRPGSLRASDAASRLSAMRLCLTSTEALLGITRRLLNSQQPATLAEQEIATKEMADETKRAGRAAYRAGLALTDPHADKAV